jgi:hypothetical protein
LVKRKAPDIVPVNFAESETFDWIVAWSKYVATLRVEWGGTLINCDGEVIVSVFVVVCVWDFSAVMVVSIPPISNLALMSTLMLLVVVVDNSSLTVSENDWVAKSCAIKFYATN